MPERDPLADRLIEGVRREHALLRSTAVDARFRDGDPLEFSLAAVEVLSGHRPGNQRYDQVAPANAQTAQVLLKTARNLVATQLIRYSPSIEELVLTHSAVVRKVEHGPLARMPADARAARLLSKLLLDSTEFEEFERRGHFPAVVYVAKLALVIDYAWRQAAARHCWFRQKPARLWSEAQGVTRRVFYERRDDPLVRVIEARYRQTWYQLTSRVLERQSLVLLDIARRRSPEPSADGVALLAELSVLDLGLRTADASLVRDSLFHLAARRPECRGHLSLGLAEAWALLFEGRHRAAEELLVALVQSASAEVKPEAAPIVMWLGDFRSVEGLKRMMSNLDS